MLTPKQQLLLKFKEEFKILSEQQTHNVDSIESAVKQKNLSAQQHTLFNLEPFTKLAPQIALKETAFITTQVEKFVMSVSALNTYLNCALGFYYKNILKIPSPKNEHMEFGIAVHYALEKLFRNMQHNAQYNFSPAQQLAADFSWYMHTNRTNFTEEAFNRRLPYGKEILTNYYEKYINSWNKIVSVERNIQGVIVNGIPLRGKLDKLEFNGKAITVVDYKSGNIDNALAKLKPPHDTDPNGGDYWRQAVFYKLLLDNYDQKDWTVFSTEFDFIEPDKNKLYRKEKVIINACDIETVKQQIMQVWAKIKARDFYTGCGKPNCIWCNPVKNDMLPGGIATA